MSFFRSSVLGFVLAVSADTALAQAAPGPGAKHPDLAYVGAMFAEACVKTHPSFRKAGRVLKANGFTKARTGTYYDSKTNFSVKPALRKECSVVAAFTGPDEKAILKFGTAVNERASDIEIDVELEIKRRAGKKYFIARTKSK